MDFNDAPPQSQAVPKPEKRLTADDLKQRLHSRLQEALYHLFPAGRVEGKTFFIGNVQGHAGDSLTVELSGGKIGLWHDFATGEGGDILSLWGAVHGWDSRSQFPQVVASIQDWLGMPARPLPKRKAKTQVDDLRTPTRKWAYLDINGNPIAFVYRFDKPGGGKEYRPWDVKAQRYKAPDLRPLYNQPGIARSENVVLVEGEKCAEALIDIGICATTAMNGANAPMDKTDWSPLRGKHVLIWPDNDAPGKGYADRIINKLRGMELSSLSLMDIPEDKPEKWDVADAIAEGMDVVALMDRYARPVPLSPEAEEIIIPSAEDIAASVVQEGMEPVDGLITIGSDFEVGRRVLQDLRQKYGQVVFTDGDFYRYKETQWVTLTPKELHDEIEKYDGYRYQSPEKNELKVIKLNTSKKNSALHTMEQGASAKDFF